MKEKVMSVGFVLILVGFGLANLLLPDREISKFERRRLTSEEKLEEDFVGNLDEYLTDQFPFRDGLISLNTIYERHVLGNFLYNDVYVKNGYAFEVDEISQKEVLDFAEKIEYISKVYANEANHIGYSVIPSKICMLNEGWAESCRKNVSEVVAKKLGIEELDFSSKLTLDDYYRTDIHLKQNAYFEFVKDLEKKFELGSVEENYDVKKYEPFYGATYAKGSPFVRPDVIEYYTSDILDGARVQHLEYGIRPVYDEVKLEGVDSYDVFLSGPSAIVEIANERGPERELVLFRDSFGSSLAPLLVPYYGKVTLVDLRYIRMDFVPEYVDFDGADVLFVYGSESVANAHLLRVDIK